MQMMRIAATALLTAFAAPAAALTLDDAADAYVHLVLEYGAREDGYVDAYYGPAAWAEAAKATPRSVEAIAHDAATLKAEIAAIAPAADPLVQKRQRFLIAQLHALETRAAMHEGARLAFADEAEALFGARPEVRPLSDFDPLLAQIDALVPGEGELSARAAAFRRRYDIPADRLDRVMRAAIAECRARTAAHIALPANERFTLAFVTGKPWSGYNWYKGDAESLIEVNTDLPVSISRAVDLGCHEGYPGHHTLNARLETELYKRRGWHEFSVYPLYSPQSLIAEGTANYGIDLAFPGDAQRTFEARVLYPLAGLDPASAAALSKLNAMTRALTPARYSIADAFLAGRMSEAEAIDALRKYQLLDDKQAQKSLSFIKTYRSYIINYGLGRDLAQRYAEASGDAWAAFTQMISEPTLPADLMR